MKKNKRSINKLLGKTSQNSSAQPPRFWSLLLQWMTMTKAAVNQSEIGTGKHMVEGVANLLLVKKDSLL